MRSTFGAVIVGANTVLKDDPFLLGENRKRHEACRAVVDSKLSLSLNSNLIKTAHKAPVVIATTELASKSKLDKLRRIGGVEVMIFRSKSSKVPLRPFLRKLAAKGMVNVLVEGGGELAGSMIDGALVDELMFFIAPRLIGGEHVSVKSKGVRNIAGAKDLKDVRFRRFGEDILIKGSIG